MAFVIEPIVEAVGRQHPRGEIQSLDPFGGELEDLVAGDDGGGHRRDAVARDGGLQELTDAFRARGRGRGENEAGDVDSSPELKAFHGRSSVLHKPRWRVLRSGSTNWAKITPPCRRV